MGSDLKNLAIGSEGVAPSFSFKVLVKGTDAIEFLDCPFHYVNAVACQHFIQYELLMYY